VYYATVSNPLVGVCNVSQVVMKVSSFNAIGLPVLSGSTLCCIVRVYTLLYREGVGFYVPLLCLLGKGKARKRRGEDKGEREGGAEGSENNERVSERGRERKTDREVRQREREGKERESERREKKRKRETEKDREKERAKEREKVCVYV